MPNLYPEGYETEVIELGETKSGPVGYRNGIAFDYHIGDFVRDGKNMLQDSTGIESWQAWCINCIETERYKHRAYSTDFGIELDRVFQAESREMAESELTRQITEAILADPYGRAEYIQDLTLTWNAPDAIEARVTIKGINDVTIDITAYITKGER